MKKIVLIIAGMILFGSASAQDIEYLTPELIDLGRVEEGTECTGSIRFVNNGDKPVKINKVQTGCGCTAASLDKNEIAPGDTADIRYVLRTKSYSGLMRKAVTVYLDEIDPPNKRYILQADVYTDILLHPKYLNFRSVTLNPDTLVTEFLTINNKSDQTLVCQKIYSNSKAIRATPEKTVIGPGEHGRIEIILRPSEAGRRTYYLNIDTNHKLKSRIRVPVFTYVHE